MNVTDRHKLIERINTLEGLTADERSALLGLLNEKKTYGLVWEDKPEEVEKRLCSELPTLKEVKSRAIISDNPDAPNHIIIEGDNLEALTTLAYTHEGKIDVIYIDPPYNTGNTDRDGGFVYNDSFVGSDDDYKHSKWLSFMSKRLKIAKKLLSESGLIFISIGDHEMSQLISLCKEIFNERNYIETYIWISTNRPDNSSPILRRNAEFVLCVAKNAKAIKEFRGVVSATSGMPSLTKAKEKIKTIEFPSNAVHTTLPDGIYNPGVKENGRNPQWELMNEAVVKDGVFITPVILKGHSYWATNKKIKEELAAGTEIWIKSESFVPYYLKTKEAVNRPTKILPGEIVKDGLYANTELNAGIFHSKVFNNPKPSTLVHFLINFIPSKYILDFFAGSGTTLHATMALNADDGGKRQCILCTNNENNICEEVTYERNKRVINGYTKPNGEAVEGLHDNNLRYYRTAFVGRRRTPQNMRRLMLLASDMLCIKEDLYTELDTFRELPTLENGFRYFAKDSKQMLIIYNEEAIYTIIEQIEKMTVAEPITVYVFSPSNDAWNLEFVTVGDKVQLTALPAAIYNAYKRVLPKEHNAIIATEMPTEQSTTDGSSQSLFNDDEEGENEQ